METIYTPIYISLPPEVSQAIALLRSAGYDAYAVGGCVRDCLLGYTPKDWDITTNSLPDSILHVFREFRCLSHGIKFGTVTVLFADIPIEITTYRIDGKYSDSRRPDDVSFARDLREDIMRRDFTVNSLAYRENFGVIDYFGGMKDLERRVIRCVGDASERFDEDALRILRAMRFAARLGFCIERDTAHAIHAQKEKLSAISRERVCSELTGILSAQKIGVGKILCEFSDVMQSIIPELSANSLRPIDLHAIDKSPANLHVRLAVIMREIPPDIAANALMRLRFDKNTVNAVSLLLRHVGTPMEANVIFIRRMLHKIGAERLYELLAIKGAVTHPGRGSADTAPASPDTDARRVTSIIEEILARGDCFSLNDLKINGKVLMKLGFSSGRGIGTVLNRLLELVIEGKCENETNALIKAAYAQREALSVF